MRVPYRWLKEYVDVKLDPVDLARELTLRGVAVETVVTLDPGISGVVAGRLLSVQPHPRAARLRVVRVDLGREQLGIVTAAPGLEAGMLVPVACPGAVLPGGRRIAAADFRGVLSQGMLLSETELLEGKPHQEGEGIWVLPPEVEVGAAIQQVLGLDDAALELDLTPNYASHCLSMLGVATEVAAITGSAARWPAVGEAAGLPPEARGGRPPVRVEIEDPEFCPRYTAMLIEDIRIGPSPLWMQNRLRAAGMRPISNVVDVTNYVMLELGQPLHAFDYERVREGRIIVRRARPGEVMVTLDGQARALDADMLVIADPQGAIALAGVMGGLDSEITGRTRTVMLESAHFQNRSTGRTARRLGLNSEASRRFAKGTDPNGTARAAARACELLRQCGAGRPLDVVVDVYPSPVLPRQVTLRPQRCNMLTGLSLSAEAMAVSLGRLGLPVKLEGAGDERRLLVTLPTRRPDLEGEIDLVEEVARTYGYHHIPASLPAGPVTLGHRTPAQALALRARTALRGLGLTEVVTYSLEDRGGHDRLRLAPDDSRRRALVLRSPLTDDQERLRTTALTGILRVLEHNANWHNYDLAVFEIAPVFLPGQLPPADLPKESKRLALAAMGGVRPGTWLEPAQEADFFYLKGVVEALLAHLGIGEGAGKGGAARYAASRHPSLHPGRQAAVAVGETSLGHLGELHPDVQTAYGLPRRAVVAELDWDVLASLAAAARPQYQSLPRFPSIERDLALVLGREVPARRVEEVIREAGGELLREARLFDVYEGPQVPQGQRSLAYSLTYRAADRTLTDAEVDEVHGRVRRALGERLGATLRS